LFPSQLGQNRFPPVQAIPVRTKLSSSIPSHSSQAESDFLHSKPFHSEQYCQSIFSSLPALSKLVTKLFSSCFNPETDPDQKPTFEQKNDTDPDQLLKVNIFNKILCSQTQNNSFQPNPLQSVYKQLISTIAIAVSPKPTLSNQINTRQSKTNLFQQNLILTGS
jgi:hypothetical protein